ncbi:MAG: alpha/beta hydrolase [Planctomycetota bacterium]
MSTNYIPRKRIARTWSRTLTGGIASLALGSLALGSLGWAAPQSTVEPVLGSSPESLGGSFSSPYVPPMSVQATGARTLEVTLNLPGQTWAERFILALPAGQTGLAPVLVLFHGYGEDPRDVALNTPLFAEALLRGWVVVAPLGGHRYHYGIDYAQENIERTLEVLYTRLPLDPERLYAVGFSMGGGAAASFAARHLDPAGPRFAAVVNHTGSTSLVSSWETQGAQDVFESPLMFGATPYIAPFGYRRSSTVEHDAFTNTLSGERHMGLNLARVPMRNAYGLFDANFGLVEQTQALHGYLGDTSEEIVLQSATHSWATLDAASTLDWLGGHALQEPQPEEIVRTLADRSGAWNQVGLELRDENAFGTILWSARPSTDDLYLIDLENLARIDVDLERVGLEPTPGQPLRVLTQTTDGAPAKLELTGLGGPPTAVQYAGFAQGSWNYDASRDVLVLEETGSAGWARWTVLP